MQPFAIFRPGRHTAANGQSHEFTEDRLQEAIDHYDPDVSEAPIVVGHPKDNGPAFGWVKGLQRNETGEMVAVPDQVHDDFAEMVQAGRFKKRSASFYKPDAQNNPVPGVFYLRHVGFLGAQPPAVKGLSGVEFSDSDDEGVIELADMSMVGQVLSGTLRRMREFFIEQWGTEKADAVIPSYVPEDIDEFSKPSDADTPEEAPADLSEPSASGDESAGDGNTDPDPEVIKMSDAEKVELDRLRAFVAQSEARKQVDTHVQAGRIPPALAETAAEFAAGLDADEQVEFSEGDGTVERTRRDQFLSLLGQLPKSVEYDEAGGGDTGEDAIDYSDPSLAHRARAYQREHNVSYTVAMDACAAGKDKADT